MIEPPYISIDAQRSDDDRLYTATDAVVVEEPLEIRIGDEPLSVTMRTPGQDVDLVTGLLFTEGLVSSVEDIVAVEYVSDERLDEPRNSIRVVLRRPLDDLRRWQRNLMVGSSCGLCGKAAIEALCASARPLPACALPDREVLLRLADRLRETQSIFQMTGGLHAAGLFTADGTLMVAREDIGRHNAVDKAIGSALRSSTLPSSEPLVLMVSGRASFEIVQKALVARVQTVAAVSATSSLAVALARHGHVNLVAFLRGRAMSIYSDSSV